MSEPREYIDETINLLGEYATHLESGGTLHSKERHKIDTPYGYIEVSPKSNGKVVWVKLANQNGSPSWPGRGSLYKRVRNELGFSLTETQMRNVTVEFELSLD